jgi:hypothetical protein
MVSNNAQGGLTMRSLLRLVAVVSTLSLSLAGAAWAQQELTKQDRRGPVTVAVTLTLPAGAETPLKVRIALDTHSVGLDDIAFESAVALRSPDGTDVPPTAVEQVKGGGHHRQAVLVFPPPAGGSIRVVVKNVGGVSERVFLWNL